VRLRPTSDATTVRVRDGKVLIPAGPFAATKEQIGGCCLIDREDLDEAIDRDYIASERLSRGRSRSPVGGLGQFG
jgi:hypothetical protein